MLFNSYKKNIVFIFALLTFQQNILFAEGPEVGLEVESSGIAASADISTGAPVNASADASLQAPAEESDMGNDAISMPDIFQEISKIFLDAKKRQEARKALYFSQLSPEHQSILNDVQSEYSKFLGNIDIREGLADLCKKLCEGLEKVKPHTDAKDSAALGSVLQKAEKLKVAVAFGYCQFLPKRMKGMGPNGIEDLAGVMDGLMKSLMPGVDIANQSGANGQAGPGEQDDSDNPEFAFSVDDLSDFCESLTTLLQSDIFKISKNEEDSVVALKTEVADLAVNLTDILSSVLAQDQKDLVLSYLAYLEPQFNDLMSTLKKSIRAFEQTIKGYITHDEKDLSDEQKAYVFWYKSIKKYQRTALVFSTLKSRSTSCVVGTEKLFQAVAYAYDIASCFYGFYKADRDTVLEKMDKISEKIKHRESLTAPERTALSEEIKALSEEEKAVGYSIKGLLVSAAVDWGFASAMSVWFLLLQQSNMTSGVLLNSFFGNMPLETISLTQGLVSNFMIIPFAVAVFKNPSMWNRQPPKLVKSLGRIAGAWGYYHLIHGNLFGCDHEEFWNPDYSHVKKATYNLLKEVEAEVSKNIAYVLRNNTNPAMVEKVEYWTGGVVKPEAIGYIIDTFVTVFLFDNCHSNRNLILGTRGEDFLRAQNPVAAGDYDAFNQDVQNRVSFRNYYIEAAISYYVASCVGRTLGVAFAKRYQGRLANFAKNAGGKFLNGLAELNLISEDTREFLSGIGEEVIEEKDEIIMQLGLLLKGFLSPKSPFRTLIVSGFTSRGDIKIDNNLSAEEQEEYTNQQLLYMLLGVCSRGNFITHAEAADIMRFYLKEKRFDEALIRKIVESIINNAFANIVGGQVGEFAAKNALSCLVRWQGPLQVLVPEKAGVLKDLCFG